MTITFFAIPNPWVLWQVALVVAAFGVAGFIIGLFNVAGGVLMVPSLLFLPGVTPVQAVSTTFVAALPMSLMRQAQLWYYGRIDWKAAWPMACAGVVAAIAGQLVLRWIPKIAITCLVAVVAAYAGCQILFKDYRSRAAAMAKAAAAAANEPEPVRPKLAHSVQSGIEAYEQATYQGAVSLDDVEIVLVDDDVEFDEDVEVARLETGTDAQAPSATNSDASTPAAAPAAAAKPAREPLPMVRSVIVGLLGGFISSVGGLGGPIVIMPLFFIFMPPRDLRVIVGVMSPTSLCIVAASAVSTLFVGEPDLGLALVLAAVMVLSSLVGGMLQERVSAHRLKVIVACILVVVGFALLAKALADVLQ